jgi:hypothetical protein
MIRPRRAPVAVAGTTRSKDGCALAIAERLPVADATPARVTAWRSGHWATLVAALAVGLVRWLTSRPRTVIHMVPDEPGQLAIARFVGRGQVWNMLDHSTWRPAYGVLLAPATWITDDASGLYRSGLVLNAVLGAVSCVLLALVAARLTGRSRSACAALAAAVSLAPALLFTTDWVWSEALVQVTLLAFLLAALRFLDGGRLRWGIAMVVTAAAGFATHSRLLPLAVTATVLILFATWRRDLATRHAIGLLALLAIVLIAVARFSSWIVERIWEDPAATNTAAASSTGSPRPDRWRRRRSGSCGTSWSRRSGSPVSAPSPSCGRRPAGRPPIVPASHVPSTPASCWERSLRWSRSRSCS